MTEETEFAFRQPKPNRARRFAKEALELAGQGEWQEALALIERAIRLDSVNALNRYCVIRADLRAADGDDKPTFALQFYHHAIRCTRQGRYRDAKVAYLEAHELDPLFLWSANNYAWLLATSTRQSVRDGKEALKYATLVCKRSRWNCWAFLSTLAAANAECGDFRNAIGWQNAALQLAPPAHKMDALIQLRHFQAGRTYIDEGRPVAAGEEES